MVIGLSGVGILWLSAALILRRKVQRPGWIPAKEIIDRESSGRHRIEKRRGIRMEQCPNCGANVIVVREKKSGLPVVLDMQPNQEHGTVIVLGGVCRYLDGPGDYAAVRQHGFPIYTRHNIRCPGFWSGRRQFDHDPEAGTETR